MLSFTHLTVFEAIIRTKSVSLAAETLEMPQPTVSRYLKQLRDHFDNQLFVRTRVGLEPTSLAITAAPAVAQALELYRTRLSGALEFDPKTADRDFHLAASDIGHLLILPRLVEWAKQEAPGVRFKAVPLGGEKLALLQRLAAVRGRLSLCADQAAAAKWWLSMPMASVSAEGPMPKALSTRRTSPLMPGCRHQGRACPLRRARMTSNPLIVA
ncbi:LysR family transcriptional regulator [Sphingopyxis indica]|uniref:LysR family transcriptional regulator n=1 Tax=Sphingopyxis indica TaxID=436663 RepID=UPI0029390B5F|nr:LysR family transcriptional regulator [Sphingopyxis indica]